MKVSELLRKLKPDTVLYADFTQANGLDMFGRVCSSAPYWRKVLTVSKSLVTMETNKDGIKGVTRLQVPKASELFDYPGGFRIVHEDGVRLTYTFEGENNA